MTERVLIVGAASDMARATARAFGARGHALTLAARNGTARLADDVADLGLRFGVEAEAVDFDLADTESHEALLTRTTPGIVICCVGLLGDQAKARSDRNLAADIMMTNYVWCGLFLNRVAERFEREEKGAIIGISSVAGDRGRATNYIYGSAKAGFTAFLSGLRNRLAKKNVHVLTVKPGFVATRMTEGMKLPGLLTATPEEVGERIYKAWRDRRHVIYVLRRWRLVMLVIVHIPEAIFKKMRI
ncbi:MAG TPA: SDR family oxidoreductase [Rhizomicrobium sp.]|nr:SDR family oxidoreductase [Rhizomicrobium sp.]